MNRKIVYRNNLKNWGFGKEASQNFQEQVGQSERPLPSRQGASEPENFEKKPTLPKTDSSSYFGITKLFFCIFVFGLSLYFYIDKQNEVTELQMRIPVTMKEIKALKQENTRFQYEIDQFENPQHLMELARHSEFSHLKYPALTQVLVVQEGIAIGSTQDAQGAALELKPKSVLAVSK